jgi:hypothetical protein
MPRTTDDELGGRDEAPRHGRETVGTIFADTDERQPFLRGSAHRMMSELVACAC